MYYIGLDAENRITAYLEAAENPDENLWMDSPWEVPPDDFDDWLLVDGELEYSPRDLPPAPIGAAEVLTANSGALVPNATMVSPMITLGTRKVRAKAELPSTKKSAPLISATKPSSSNTIFQNKVNTNTLFSN